MSILISKAREWLGTSWQHNQRKKGIGVDCVNFLTEVAKESGYQLKPIPKEYGRTPITDGIRTYLNENLEYKNSRDIESEDILLFKFAGYNNHVAIATSINTMIHASLPHKRVIENSIDELWLRMLTGIWRLKK